MLPNPDTPVTLAVRHLQEGRPDQAKVTLSAACHSGKADASEWFLYGASLHQLGELDAALEAFARSILLGPENPQAWSAKAAILLELKRPSEALDASNVALTLSPEAPELLHNTACIMEELGHAEAALAGYQRAIEQKPDFLPALINRTLLLARTHHLEAARAAAHQAVTRHPAEPECWYLIGDICLALMKPEEALKAFEQALKLESAYLPALMGRAMSLSALARFDEAFAVLGEVQESDAHFFAEYKSPLGADHEETSMARDPRRIFFVMQFMRLEICDWSERSRFYETLCEQIRQPERYITPLRDRGLPHPALTFALDPHLRLELMRQVAEGVAASVKTQAAFIRPKANPRGRLRIGYVSPDFRLHATAHLTRRLYGLHDRSRFEVFAYSLYPGDDSDLAADIRRDCDRFRQVAAFDSASLIRQIREDGIDILVDLAGYTRYARPEVFAARCAPVQVGYLGFPCTLGGETLDYVVVDSQVCPPGSECNWSEPLVRLPGVYAIYDDKSPVSAPVSRAYHGLPEQAIVLCCFNAAWKLSPEIFAVWMRLLNRIPQSILWLWGAVPAFQDNLRREARRAGADPERLVFAGSLKHSAHLARYPHADLFLDTLPCNAHTTAADALWMGVPVLTCLGNEMHGRVAASLLHAAGMPELVAPTLAEYEALAYRLATEPGVLSSLRDRLAALKRSGALFNTRDKVADLEMAYEMMWQQYHVGMPPAGFDVPPAKG
jgi:predicted O-linked N-acetylglucosamine transferase (SPINDLY family)